MDGNIGGRIKNDLCGCPVLSGTTHFRSPCRRRPLLFGDGMRVMVRMRLHGAGGKAELFFEDSEVRAVLNKTMRDHPESVHSICGSPARSGK